MCSNHTFSIQCEKQPIFSQLFTLRTAAFTLKQRSVFTLYIIFLALFVSSWPAAPSWSCFKIDRQVQSRVSHFFPPLLINLLIVLFFCFFKYSRLCKKNNKPMGWVSVWCLCCSWASSSEAVWGGYWVGSWGGRGGRVGTTPGCYHICHLPPGPDRSHAQLVIYRHSVTALCISFRRTRV